MLKSVFLCGLIICTGVCSASIINIPVDQPTIQDGIDIALSGDTILVASGTYSGEGNRDLDFQGKQIVVKSDDGPEVTIIDCEGSENEHHRGFFFHNSEDSLSIVDGFTIQNGYHEKGGGIFCSGPAHPTIKRCTLQDNFGTVGGGIDIDANLDANAGHPFVDDCIIRNNSSYSGGGIHVVNVGGVHLADCEIYDNISQSGAGGGVAIEGLSVGRAERCVIYDNQALGTNTYSGGGGIYNGQHCWSFYTNCTIVDNYALHYGAAINCVWGGGVTLENCIVAFNTGTETYSCTEWDAYINASCTDSYGNEYGDWEGCLSGQGSENDNFSNDPLFCDYENDLFSIARESPCATINNACDSLVGAYAVGCNNTRMRINPDPVLVASLYALDPQIGHIFIGNSEFGTNTISLPSLRINGTIIPEEFRDHFMNEWDETAFIMSFDQKAFIESYGEIWGTDLYEYEVSGQYVNGTTFILTNNVTIIGHVIGDANTDGLVNVGDAIYIINYVFRLGTSPRPWLSGDVNADDMVDVGDAIYLINFIFKDGPPPTVRIVK